MKKEPKKDPKKKIDYYGWIDEEFPLVIWKSPNVDEDMFNKALNDFREKDLGETGTETNFCKCCDDNLLQISGPKALTFVQGTVAGGNSSGSKTARLMGIGGNSFEEDAFYYSANFKCKIPPPPPDSDKAIGEISFQKSGYTEKAVTAAIFDSGLDNGILHLDPSYLAEISSLCLPTAVQGWNFVGDNSNTNDDSRQKHGTIVSNFIVEQENQFNKAGSLLPVKTHNMNGEGNLFDILCGLAYAAKSGVKVINASFGYYSFGNDGCTRLFKEFIDYYLTQRNILLICAAGNVDDAADKAIKISKGKNADPRNLEINPFYPACFSSILPNVITVTTVNKLDNSVSPLQNYSACYVDVGVNCDDTSDTPCNYSFNTPWFPVIGSSFATPIVTGKICAKFNSAIGDDFAKWNTIQQMCDPVPGLRDKIKYGMVVKTSID